VDISGVIGEYIRYQNLEVAVLFEGEGAFRIQIVDGGRELSSTCCGYTHSGIRGRALELAYGYLLKRDGNAPKPGLVWQPIRIDLEPRA